MKMFKLVGAFLLFIAPFTMQAQEKNDSTMRFSLTGAQEYAIENSYSVRSSKLDLESAKKKILETTAIGLPQFTVKAQYQNIFEVPELPSTQLMLNNAAIPFGSPVTINPGSTLNYNLGPSIALGVKENVTIDYTLSQLIFSGEYIVGLQASRTYRLLSEQSLTKSIKDIKENIANVYCLVLITAENVKIVEENYKTISKITDDMTQMNKQGFIDETDLDQLNITKVNLENTLFSLKRQNEVTINQLKFLMGLSLNQNLILTDSIPSIIESGNKTIIENTTYNVQNNIDYQLMATSEKLNLLSLRREKSKFLPTIAAFYRHQQLMDEPAINFNPPNVLGVSIELPIFQSGMRYAKVKQARFALDKSTLAKEQAERGLQMDFDQSRNAYLVALKTYSTSKQSLGLAKKIYERSMTKYKEGTESSTGLNQNQSQYLQSQTSYFMSVMDLFNKKTKLEKLLTSSN
jgi:outer membrane protein